MMKKILYLFFAITVSWGVYAFPVQDPPAPGTKSHNEAAGPNPCGRADMGRGVPPPVGLCLPINDYLLPLLIMGILLGAWKVRPKTTIKTELPED